MLTVEIKVDDNLICQVSIRNPAGDMTTTCQYEWEAREGVALSQYQTVASDIFKGVVMHKHADGFLKLIEKTIHEVLCEMRFQAADKEGDK